jgi:hypothetical protein
MLMRQVVGPWHHVALFWKTEDGLFVVEATGKGVICTDYSIWLMRWPGRITKVIPIPCEARKFTRHSGKRYDCFSFVIACLVKIVSHRWIGLTGDKSTDKLYCFELAALAHGYPGAYSVLPSEFLEIFTHEPV